MKLIYPAVALLAAVATPALASAPAAALKMVRPERFLATPSSLYVETGGDWYRAEMAQPCLKLPGAKRISIQTAADGSLNRSSAVIAKGERCAVAYVTPSAVPIELLLNPDG